MPRGVPNKKDEKPVAVPCMYAFDPKDVECSKCNGCEVEFGGKMYPAETGCSGYTPYTPAVETTGESAVEDAVPTNLPAVNEVPTFDTSVQASADVPPDVIEEEDNYGEAPPPPPYPAPAEKQETPGETAQSPQEAAPSTIYAPLSMTTLIRAESGVTLEFKDAGGVSRWYKFTYSEERSIPYDANIVEERKALWNVVNDEVDKQAEDIANFLKNS